MLQQQQQQARCRPSIPLVSDSCMRRAWPHPRHAPLIAHSVLIGNIVGADNVDLHRAALSKWHARGVRIQNQNHFPLPTEGKRRSVSLRLCLKFEFKIRHIEQGLENKNEIFIPPFPNPGSRLNVQIVIFRFMHLPKLYPVVNPYKKVKKSKFQ